MERLLSTKENLLTTYPRGLPVSETRVERKDLSRCSDEISVRTSSCI